MVKFNNKQFFLGLPGNPVSCFMSMLKFFSFVYKKNSMEKITKLSAQTLKSKFFIKKTEKLATFQRVRCTNEKFELFKYQDSSIAKIFYHLLMGLYLEIHMTSQLKRMKK